MRTPAGPRLARAPRRCAAVAVAVAALSFSGCYRYIPTTLGVVPPEQSVRLLVSDQGSRELSQVTDVQGPVPSVVGKVTGRDGDVMLIQVPVSTRQDGFRMINLEQIVRIPAGEILRVDRREIDPIATGAFIAGSGLLATAVIFLIMDAFSDPSSGPGEDPDLSVLLRIPIG